MSLKKKDDKSKLKLQEKVETKLSKPSGRPQMWLRVDAFPLQRVVWVTHHVNTVPGKFHPAKIPPT